MVRLYEKFNLFLKKDLEIMILKGVYSKIVTIVMVK